MFILHFHHFPFPNQLDRPGMAIAELLLYIETVNTNNKMSEYVIAILILVLCMYAARCMFPPLAKNSV
jgi:hypothetical protein